MVIMIPFVQNAAFEGFFSNSTKFFWMNGLQVIKYYEIDEQFEDFQ